MTAKYCCVGLLLTVVLVSLTAVAGLNEVWNSKIFGNGNYRAACAANSVPDRGQCFPSGGLLCNSTPTATPEGLGAAMGWACGPVPFGGGVDCSPIASPQQKPPNGGELWFPDSEWLHADYVYNAYYQAHPTPEACGFPFNGVPTARLVEDTKNANPENQQYPPAPYPCPCPIVAGDGTQALPGTGGVSQPNPDKLGFQDTILADGFMNPVDVAFTDNNLLFVLERAGMIYRIDLTSGSRILWFDFSKEVALEGDHGALAIAVHPNFAANPFVYFAFVVQTGNPVEGASPQKLDRIREVNGLPALVDDVVERVSLIGKTYRESPALCSSTHSIDSVRFGLDGSLIISVGDGAKYDFEIGSVWENGDFGQNYSPIDAQCEEVFGEEQDFGVFRSQVLTSLSGKLLRIDPLTGAGICDPAGQFPVLNPFCDGNDESAASKIWALGLRNPFRLNIRPLDAGESYDGGPGAIYVTDVGFGSFEEVNVVVEKGQNLGWPCWEGPLPQCLVRKSALQYDPTINHATLNGQMLTCENLFHNVRTTLPFFTWSRYAPGAGWRDFSMYTAQGFTGNCPGGVMIYKGTSYPAWFRGAVFIADYGQQWIRVAKRGTTDETRDTYTGEIRDFIQQDTPIVTLDVEPATGNLVYLTLARGEVHVVRYGTDNTAPVVQLQATPQTSAATSVPVTVAFNLDGTYDRENNQISFLWDFGDGSPLINTANPTHVYTTAGVFTASATVVDSNGASTNASIKITTNNVAPTVAILQPVANAARLYTYNPAVNLVATSQVTDENVLGVEYYWELALVHTNHIHNFQLVRNTPNININMTEAAGEGHSGTRANLKLIFRATDSSGLWSETFMFLVAQGYVAQFGNNNPVANFNVNGVLQAAQIVRFDATVSTDANLDYLLFSWNFGDAGTTTFSATSKRWDSRRLVSHVYAAPGTYAVTLVVTDNFGGTSTITKQVTIVKGQAFPPIIETSDASLTTSSLITLSTRTLGANIWFTLDGSVPVAQRNNSLLYNGSFSLNSVLSRLSTQTPQLTIRALAYVVNTKNANNVNINPSTVITRAYNLSSCWDLGMLDGCNLFCATLLQSTPLTAKTVPLFAPTLARDNEITTPPTNKSQKWTYLIRNLTGNFVAARGNTKLNLLFARVSGSTKRSLHTRVSYDFENDGVYDRTEVFQPVIVHDLAATLVRNTDNVVQPFFSVEGSDYRTLANGLVRLEVWLGSSGATTNAYTADVTSLLVDGLTAAAQMTRVSLPYLLFTSNVAVQQTDCSVACNGNLALTLMGECGDPNSAPPVDIVIPEALPTKPTVALISVQTDFVLMVPTNTVQLPSNMSLFTTALASNLADALGADFKGTSVAVTHLTKTVLSNTVTQYNVSVALVPPTTTACNLAREQPSLVQFVNGTDAALALRQLYLTDSSTLFAGQYTKYISRQVAPTVSLQSTTVICSGSESNNNGTSNNSSTAGSSAWQVSGWLFVGTIIFAVVAVVAAVALMFRKSRRGDPDNRLQNILAYGDRSMPSLSVSSEHGLPHPKTIDSSPELLQTSPRSLRSAHVQRFRADRE